MQNGKVIIERQLKEENIRLLAAQRNLYSTAKRLVTLQILLIAVIPIIGAVISSRYPDIRPWVALYSLAILFIDSIFIDGWIKLFRHRAAGIQELFDTKIFYLEWPQWHLPEKPDLDAIHYYSKAILKSKERTKKLECWYPIAVGKVTDAKAILYCQRYNISFGIGLRSFITVLYAIVVLLLPICFVAFGLYEKWLVENFLIHAVLFLPGYSWIIKECFRQNTHKTNQVRIQKHIKKQLDNWNINNRTQSEIDEVMRSIQTEILILRENEPLLFDWYYWFFKNHTETILQGALEEYIAQE